FARAVVFSFIEENLREFFPPEIMASLKDDLNNAHNEFDVLGGIAGKMKFIPSGVEVWPSYDIDERNPKDWNLAYHALMEEFVIQADYNSSLNSGIERVHLSPQRVQYANHKVVLLCYIHDSGEVKSYEVSRLMNVKKSADYKFKTVNFNDIETEYEFEALVNLGVKNYFDSVKFGNELKSTPSINGVYLVKAKIQVPDHFSESKKGQPDPFAIANFLSTFADSMEVLEPDFLREEMKRRADNISKLYSDKHDSTPIIKKSHHVQTGNLKKLKEIDEGR
ncbi:WYL domain-containing protein, partial [Colwellia sp. BRX8-8]|nr:WYL domain-containing protein [Colwellia sp. BRX8-8]